MNNFITPNNTYRKKVVIDMPNFMPKKYHYTLDMIKGKFVREIMQSMC